MPAQADRTDVYTSVETCAQHYQDEGLGHMGDKKPTMLVLG